MQLEGLGKLIESIQLIESRTRDLPACRTVPQPLILRNRKGEREQTSTFTDVVEYQSYEEKLLTLLSEDFCAWYGES
jgi:hypothetical protein